MNYDSLLIKIRRKYKTFKKFDHLEGVSQTAFELSNIFLPKKAMKAKIAGLLHDIARYFSDRELIEISQSLYHVSKEERSFPILLHGKAAAVIAKNEFGIDDRETLSAIADHVTGRANMPTLSKIIFISDVIEPNRNFENVSELRKLAFLDLDLAFSKIVENKIIWLLKRRLYVSKKTINLWNKIITEEE